MTEYSFPENIDENGLICVTKDLDIDDPLTVSVTTAEITPVEAKGTYIIDVFNHTELCIILLL